MNNNYLYHHGIKGQRWGVRRYQNSDGSLTPAGVKRYYQDGMKNSSDKNEKKILKEEYKMYKQARQNAKGWQYDSATKEKKNLKIANKSINKLDRIDNKVSKYRRQGKIDKANKTIEKGKNIYAKALNAATQAQIAKIRKEYFNKKISEMDSLKIKAGKDYFYSVKNIAPDTWLYTLDFNDGNVFKKTIKNVYYYT